MHNFSISIRISLEKTSEYFLMTNPMYIHFKSTT